jgi:hypothetical protein
VTLKRGTHEGVGASVSGAGAWVEIQGDMSFLAYHLDSTKTYHRMEKEYDIGAGIGGFWSWLGVSAHASTHKQKWVRLFWSDHAGCGMSPLR